MAISSHFYFWLAQYTPTLLAESFSGNERAQTKMAMSWMRGEKKKKIFLAELASWQHKKVRNGKIIVIFLSFLNHIDHYHHHHHHLPHSGISFNETSPK